MASKTQKSLFIVILGDTMMIEADVNLGTMGLKPIWSCSVIPIISEIPWGFSVTRFDYTGA